VPDAPLAPPAPDPSPRAIHPRNLRFEFEPSRVADWHPAGTHVSHFYNALSLLLPAGEAFFVDSARHFEVSIASPALREAVRGFLAQETLHGREHQRYNDALAAAGYPAAYLAKRAANLCRWLGRHLSAKARLAVTVAVEHETAMLSGVTVTEPRILDGCAPAFAGIWWWHTIEEIEHKSVAFDLYREVVAGRRTAYPRRAVAMLAVWLAFATGAFAFTAVLIARDRRLTDLRGWRALFRFLFVSPRALRGQLRGVLDFLRPSFHPSQRDDHAQAAAWIPSKLPSS
jgi:predicted metal-dependent hydrolase